MLIWKPAPRVRARSDCVRIVRRYVQRPQIRPGVLRDMIFPQAEKVKSGSLFACGTGFATRHDAGQTYTYSILNRSRYPLPRLLCSWARQSSSCGPGRLHTTCTER